MLSVCGADRERSSHTAQPQSSLIHRQGRRQPTAAPHRLYPHHHPHILDEETILFFSIILTRPKYRDHDLHNRHPHQAPQRVHRKSPRKPPRRPALCLQEPVAADSPCYRVTKLPLKSPLDRHTAESSSKVRFLGRSRRLSVQETVTVIMLVLSRNVKPASTILESSRMAIDL